MKRWIIRLVLCGALLQPLSLIYAQTVEMLDRNLVSGPVVPRDFVLYESGQVRPLALSHNGKRLYALNTPAGRLEIFAVSKLGLLLLETVAVGLEPVAVAVTADDQQVWVVNHLSDSVSIVDVSQEPARVEKTLWVGDEPRDIVFAGPGYSKAFVTAAHRGQNRPGDPQLTTSGVGRADVWVFDRNHLGNNPGGTSETILSLFGDTPRALAVNADGSRVYAAVFHSGNQTTTLSPQTIAGIQKPPPVDAADGVARPNTGIIVKFVNGQWVDESGRNYNNRVGLSLPDQDVFEIDATASPPAQTQAHTSVGTTLFNMAVNPQNNAVYVSNTDARNHIRFAGVANRANSTVRGHLTDARITVIKNGQVQPRLLNRHIDFTKASGDQKDRDSSLAQPMDMVVSGDGSKLFVTAFGSQKLAVFDTQALETDQHAAGPVGHIELSAGGPSGVVLDETNQRLYVMTRFDNGISTIDVTSETEISHLQLFNPEPETITQGRKFLYDARLTSGFGTESCGSCHIFADNDALAWDLGDPDGEVTSIPNAYHPLTANNRGLNFTFHPMKGPMTTQSMRGLARHGPQHWRGDRTGQNRLPGETLEEAAFKEFNDAFDALGALDGELSEDDMQAFTNFALQINYPPNPNRLLDNTLTDIQNAGQRVFNNGIVRSNGVREICVTCHTLDPVNGFYGTTGLMAFNDQPGEKDFKIPHFRDQYQKIGMFTLGFNQPAIRGFAFNHNGATSNDALFQEFGTSSQVRNQIKEFLYAFQTESAPILGQQISLNKDNFDAGKARLDLLVQQADLTEPVPECDLVAVDGAGGKAWAYDRNQNAWQADTGVNPLSTEQIFDHTWQSESAITFSCGPWGSGRRMAVDSDLDGMFNAVEKAQGSDPDSAASSTFRPDSGMWYNPQRSGFGVDIHQSRNNLVLTWTTYNQDGSSTWYQAVAAIADQWQAELFQYQWDPDLGGAVGEIVGSVELDFASPSSATMNWQVGNQTGQDTIQRLLFSRKPTEITTTGLWYDPTESGYGITMDTQGDVRIIIVYFYDNQNQPRWVYAQQDNLAAGRADAIKFDGFCPWCTAKPIEGQPGGTVELNFTSFGEGILDLNVSSAGPGNWVRNQVSLKRLTAPVNPNFQSSK